MPATTPRPRALVALAAAALLALAGCSQVDGEPLGDVVTGDWTLASAELDGEALDLTGVTVTLAADEEGFSGRGPCNSYGAAIGGDTAALQVLALSSTEAACADEPLNELETAYFALLQGAGTATLDGGALVLAGEDGELRFDPAPSAEEPVEEPATGLVGTVWHLESLTAQGTDVPIAAGEDGATPTLSLGEDGRTTGSTGCRPIEVDYTVSGTSVQFDGFPADAVECSDATLGQDDMLFTLLGFGFDAELGDGTLTAANAEFGLVATFTAS